MEMFAEQICFYCDDQASEGIIRFKQTVPVCKSHGLAYREGASCRGLFDALYSLFIEFELKYKQPIYVRAVRDIENSSVIMEVSLRDGRRPILLDSHIEYKS